MENLPDSKVLIQVHYLNFRTVIETIDLTKTFVKNFALEHTVTELNEVVVTRSIESRREQKRTPTPIIVVPKIELMQNSSTNIIDAIAVAARSFTNYNRVRNLETGYSRTGIQPRGCGQ